MKEAITVGTFLRGLIELCPDINSITSAGGKKDLTHLSVYETITGSPVGVEYDHTEFVNIWVRKTDVDLAGLDDVEFEEKVWRPLAIRRHGDSPWASRDERAIERKGANSNLASNAWPAFRENDLFRFKAARISDVMRVLGEVLRGKT